MMFENKYVILEKRSTWRDFKERVANVIPGLKKFGEK